MYNRVTAIARIIDGCKAQTPNFTLKVMINYGNPVMRLHGYHIPGQPWVVWQHAGMIEFTQTEMNAIMQQAGIDFAARPVKQPGFDYHWLMMVTEEVDARMLNLQANLVADGARRYQAFNEAVSA